MHFCSSCQNMYYIRISDNSDKLIYYCRHCGNEDNSLSFENATVSSTDLSDTSQKFNHIINRYTKLDPTLPRIDKMLCPNAECTTNTKNEPREIIYIRYDDVNMKYIYLCSTCDIVWNTEKEA